MADNSVSLLFRAKGQTEDAQRAFKELKASITNDVDAIDGKGKTGFASLSESMGLSTAAAAGLVAGVTAIAAAAAVAVVGIFRLTESTAEFAGKLFDAQEKLGLSASTLTTLKFNADLAGSSLEQISTSTTKFAKLMGAANDGNEKAIKTLAALGVTSKDLDGGLAQVFKTINDARPGVEQITLAQKAFGKSGADLIPVIKQMGGSMDEARAAAEKLGLTLTNADLKAADDFGDTLATLKAQAAALGHQFALELMPSITTAMQAISNALSANKDVIRGWGSSLVHEYNSIITIIETADKVFTDSVKTFTGGLSNIDGKLSITKAAFAAFYDGILPVNAALREFDRLRNGETASGVGQLRLPITTPNKLPGSATQDEINAFQSSQGDPNAVRDAEKAAEKEREAARKKAADDRRRAREEEYKREQTAQKEHNSLVLEQLRADFQTSQAELEKNFIQAAIPLKEFQSESLTNIDVYSKEAQRLLTEAFNFDANGKTKAELDNLQIKQKKRLEDLGNDVKKERAGIEKTIADSAAKETAIVTKAEQDKAAIRRATSSVELQRLANDRQKEFLTELAYVKRVSAEKVSVLESELKSTKGVTEQTLIRRQIEEEILSLENQVTGIEIRRRDAEAQANAAKQAAQAEQAARQREQSILDSQVTTGGGIGQGIAQGLGVNLVSIFDPKQLGQLKTHAQFIKDVFKDIKLSVGGAIGEITRGFGNMLAQAIITGKFSAAAFLGMVAQITIGLAIESGIKAIFELAEGYASLAATFGIPNPSSIAHFAAAGHYAAVAAIAGGVGVAAGIGARALTPPSSSGYGSAGSPQSNSRTGGGVTQYSGQPDVIREGGLNSTLPAVRIDMNLRLDTNGVLQVVHNDIRSNGRLRTTIQDAAAA